MNIPPLGKTNRISTKLENKIPKLGPNFRNEDKSDDKPRLTWSLEVFHDVEIDQEAPKWRRIFQRGIAMRRNICQGKFELWRLFLTDEGSLPVKKMNKNTTHRELRCDISIKSIMNFRNIRPYSKPNFASTIIEIFPSNEKREKLNLIQIFRQIEISNFYAPSIVEFREFAAFSRKSVIEVKSSDLTENVIV